MEQQEKRLGNLSPNGRKDREVAREMALEGLMEAAYEKPCATEAARVAQETMDNVELKRFVEKAYENIYTAEGARDLEDMAAEMALKEIIAAYEASPKK